MTTGIRHDSKSRGGFSFIYPICLYTESIRQMWLSWDMLRSDPKPAHGVISAQDEFS